MCNVIAVVGRVEAVSQRFLTRKPILKKTKSDHVIRSFNRKKKLRSQLKFRLCALCLYPANPGRGLWSLCLGLAFGFHPANPGWGRGVCVFVCAHRLYPADPSWGVRCGCVCLGSGRLRPAIPCWGVGVCVFVCALCLYPAIPGWGVPCGCVCLG